MKPRTHILSFSKEKFSTKHRSLIPYSKSFWVLSFFLQSTLSHAVDLEPLEESIKKHVGAVQVQNGKLDGVPVRIVRNSQKKLEKIVFIQTNIWQNQCSHVWTISLQKDGKVEQVRAQNQQCPHAEPARKESFLSQYKGIGPADLSQLRSKVSVVAKATGSANLATDAVEASIKTFEKYKAKL